MEDYSITSYQIKLFFTYDILYRCNVKHRIDNIVCTVFIGHWNGDNNLGTDMLRCNYIAAMNIRTVHYETQY